MHSRFSSSAWNKALLCVAVSLMCVLISVAIVNPVFGLFLLVVYSSCALIVALFLFSLDQAVLISGCGLLLVVLAVPLLRLPITYSNLRAGAVVAFFLILVILLIRANKLPISVFPGIVLGLYVILFYGRDLFTSQRGILTEASLSLLVALAGLTLGKLGSDRAVRTWVRLFVTIMLLESIYSVIEVSYSIPPLWVGGYTTSAGENTSLPSELFPGLERAQGTFGHPLIFSFFLVVAVFFARRFGSTSMTRVGLSLVLLLGVAASGSRSAVVLAAGVLFFSKSSRVRAPQFLLLLGATLALTGAYSVQFSRFTDDILQTGSFTHRAAALDSLNEVLARSSPFEIFFGRGVVGLNEAFVSGTLQSDGLFAVDNQFVLLLVSTGILGVALFAMMLARVLVATQRDARTLLGILLIYLLLFDVLAWLSTAFAFWLLVGYMVRTEESRRSAAASMTVGFVPRADADKLLISLPANSTVASGTSPR